MEFLPFLPVIVFFVFVLFIVMSIMKKVARKAIKNGVAKKPVSFDKRPALKKTGWKDVLGEAVAQIQAEIKKAQQEQEKARQKKTAREKARSAPKSALVWGKNDGLTAPPPLPAKKRKTRIESAAREEKPIAPPVIEEPTVAEPPLVSTGKPDARELRKAVVWSEILQPPVALRKDRKPF